MLLVLYTLICCITQVSHISEHERTDDEMEFCKDDLSQITLECDRCMNQDWCRSWFYGSPVPGAKCFEFWNSITQQIHGLSDKKHEHDDIENFQLQERIRKLEAELEICTGNFELATINNQTTIVSVQFLHEIVNNLSKTFETFVLEQHDHVDKVDVKLRGLKSHIDTINQTLERKCSGRLKQMQLRINRLQVEQKNHTDNSVFNVSSTLLAKIQKESTLIKDQLMSTFSGSETKIKSDIGVLNKTYDEEMKNIKTDQSKSESRLKSMVQELSDSLRTVNETVFELEAVKVHFQNTFEGHKSNITKLETQLKSELNDRITTVSNTWKTELDSKSSFLEQKLEEIKVNVTQETQTLATKIYLIETNFRTMENKLNLQIGKVKEELQLTINEQRSTIERKLESKMEKMYTGIEKKMRAMKQRMFKENDKLKRQTKEVSQNVTTQKEKIDIIYPNTFNKEMLQMAFLCLAVLVMINFAMVYYYRPSAHMTPTIMESANIIGNAERRFQSSIEILRQVPSKPQLQAAVCIISFDEGRQAAHRQLLDSTNLVNYRVVTYVVRRHANIPDLPRCKVYLMCTEFTERHVIIEEQGLGLGDLHRTTYDAVLKLGGQLIILYTKDPGSRRLKEDEVYNKNIYCVAHQQELVELNNLGRFFSVYDTLTAQQKTKLRKTIMDCLQ